MKTLTNLFTKILPALAGASLLTVAAHGATVYGANGTDVAIPDNAGWVRSDITISGAPSWAVVTSIDVHFSAIHTYSGDLNIDVNDQNVTRNYDFWSREGGSTPNPSRTVYGITTFNGLAVNGTWHLYARDEAAGDTGYIDEWWIQIHYDKSVVFDPNPVNTLNNCNLADNGNADSAGLANAYVAVDLTHLSAPVGGLYYLIGDYARMEDIEAPANTPPSATVPMFLFHRNVSGFEEVMAYYHVTHSEEYIQTLGFLNINNRSHRIDAHGFNGADNSHYVGSPVGTGYMAFGDGGVDDAEDADIILHEYGHSIQDNSTTGKYFGNGNNGYGNETGAMGEGFGDYWACSSGYASSIDRKSVV
jgi:subtilisin-like proprotein convertase family protein